MPVLISAVLLTVRYAQKTKSRDSAVQQYGQKSNLRIRQRDGIYEYYVYFAKELPVLEYRKQRREHEDALKESTRSKPKTFLAFYIKKQRHQHYKPDIRKYQRELK